MSSSPDPLNDFPTFLSPAKPIMTGTRKSLPMQSSSPRKQTFQLDVGDKLSPQKIRVTVEAEDSGNDGNNGHRRRRESYLVSPTSCRAPMIRQTVRTTTTTVPVKGLSDSEDDLSDSPSEKCTRGRGRPRKSFGTPVPTKNRNRAVTPRAKPSPRRRRALGDLVDGDDPDDWDFKIGAGVEVGRGKGRSRSRSVKAAWNKGTPAAQEISSPDKIVSSTTSRKGQGRRKTPKPEEVMIHEDEVEATHNTSADSSDTSVVASRVLAQRHINIVPTKLVHPANRSTTTTHNDYADILLDKFSPAKKTLVGAARYSSEISLVALSSPAASGVDVPLANTILPVESPMQNITEVAATHSNEDEANHTSNDLDKITIDEFQEYDTILESEGFSMISVDSVPSLREHLSSPSGPDQHYPDIRSTVDNGDSSRLKNVNGVGPEESFSSPAPETLKATTPGERAQHPILNAVRSANNLEYGDSFSSIPPEILEAATPGRQRLSNKFLSIKVNDFKSHDDSFSSIPSAVLEAATPAKHLHADIGLPKPNPEGNEKQKHIARQQAVTSIPLPEAGRQSFASSGLLTPNETPSPTEIAIPKSPNTDHRNGGTISESRPNTLPSTEESSIINKQIRSSPPSAAPRRFTYSVYTHQQKSLYPKITETPSIVFSSPSLPPLIQQVPLERSQMSSNPNSNKPPRASISPIVQAGKALREIAISPSSSSRGRTQSLGSPFKSPAAQRKPAGISIDASSFTGVGGGSQKSQDKGRGIGGDIFVGFSDDTRRELRKSLTVGEELARNQRRSAKTAILRSAAQEEDPFHSGNKSRRLLSPEEGKEYTLDLPNEIHGLGSRDGQLQDSVCSDSAMSWQAESAVTLHTPVSSAGIAASNQVQDSMSFHGIVDDTEEDIWQAEARHSSPLVEEQALKLSSVQERLERPRRSKIPSPWRKNSKRLVYSDEVAQLCSPPKSENPKDLPSQVQPRAESIPGQISVRKRVSTEEVTEEEDLPEPSIMWHIPQKLNFAPRPRTGGSLDLSALLGPSPVKMSQSALQADISRGNGSKSSNVNPSSGSSATTNEDSGLDSMSYVENPLSTDNSFQDESHIESTGASYEESELISEPSCTNAENHNPTLPQNVAPTPHKSCLRTPTSTSPTKSVAFVSPTPSPSPLSATTWSKAHWTLLDGIYQDSKSLRTRDREDSVEPSIYLGKTIYARGMSMTLEQWHLDIVSEFREEVPGWDEGIIAKRLFAIIVGEDLRRQGKME